MKNLIIIIVIVVVLASFLFVNTRRNKKRTMSRKNRAFLESHKKETKEQEK